jgi:lipoprotein-anchoring transpeptidase ErfK/SrfK
MADAVRMPVSPPTSGRGRAALAGVAVGLALVPIVLALELSRGGGATAQTTTTVSEAAIFNPGQMPKLSPPNYLIPPGRGTLVAIVNRSTTMRSRPGGRAYGRLGLQTSFGSPQAVWVVKLRGAWLGVISAVAGNGHVGWIPAASASLARVNWKLEVSLSARRLTVLHAGRMVERYKVAVGKPSAPTPTGHFAVTDHLLTGDPAGPYGCCILALSAEAPHAIQDWSGGNRIAIHSTPETSSIGLPVSHGCLRLTLAEGRWLLAHIPLGTPTLISS